LLRLLSPSPEQNAMTAMPRMAATIPTDIPTLSPREGDADVGADGVAEDVDMAEATEVSDGGADAAGLFADAADVDEEAVAASDAVVVTVLLCRKVEPVDGYRIHDGR
jgi:hypothetical protein